MTRSFTWTPNLSVVRSTLNGRLDYRSGEEQAEFEIRTRRNWKFEGPRSEGFNANYVVTPLHRPGVVAWTTYATTVRGKGELEYEGWVTDDPPHRSPPVSPLIAAGTSVSVGDQMRGVFADQIDTNDTTDSHHDDDDDCALITTVGR